GGRASCAPSSGEQILASSFSLHTGDPWTIEVTLRGDRGGIVFGLQDTGARSFSQLVRLDGTSVLSGYFDAMGIFSVKSVFPAPPASGDSTTLRIDVDGRGGACDVYVNGTRVGTESALLFPGGHIGLECSGGPGEFHSVKVRGLSEHPAPLSLKRGSRAHFSHVSFVRGGKNNVVVYSEDTQSYLAFDLRGKLLRQQRAPKPADPGPHARSGGSIYTADSSGVTVSDGSGTVVRKIPLRLVLPSALLVGRTGVIYVADAGAHELLRINGEGTGVVRFSGESVGEFLGPRGMDFYGSDQIVVADDNRLIFLGLDLNDSVLIRPSGSGVLSVSWHSAGGTQPFVRYGADFEHPAESDAELDDVSGLAHAEIHGVREGTRYSIYVSNALRVIGTSEVISAPYRWVSPPADSVMRMVARLPILYMVYRNASQEGAEHRGTAKGGELSRSLSEDDVSYLKESCKESREFIFQNSLTRLSVDFSVAVIEDTLRMGSSDAPEACSLGADERITREFERASRSFGRHTSDYAGVIVAYPCLDGKEAGRQPLVQAAPSAVTLGIPAPWKYGASTCFSAIPFTDRASRQEWLVTRAIQEQLRSLLRASGSPTFPNPDEPWKIAGKFGEDFDESAHILRSVPEQDWLLMRFGRITLTRDANHDGIPDEDASLPYDRRHLRPRPVEGLSRSIAPDPGRPFERAIYPASIPLKPFASLKGDDLSAFICAGWTDSALYLRVESDTPSALLLQIDGNSDGWFHGFDNTDLRVSYGTRGPEVIDAFVRDCSSPDHPPNERRDVFHGEALRVWGSTYQDTLSRPSTEEAADHPSVGALRIATHRVLTLRLARQDAYGLDFRRGKQIAMRLCLQSLSGVHAWEELFDRNYMMTLELK
ncbi:MAG TPA: hypothetical protein VEO56_02490, partial [Bacteroidota bacterium]|nr:hypothetical protein [Bacteroidota bacterium]